MVAYPDVAFRSAVRGLEVWWDVVFPALLPFFIGGQILMGLGVVAFMGVLLEPLMRPLFGVPGEGAFVVAMGLNSGYPLGAALTADLRRRGGITATEATRLACFSNTSDPLFMSGAVAVGMLREPRLAGVIMTAHYLGAIAVGLLLKFLYRPGRDETPRPVRQPGGMLTRALRALVRERRADGRPFGEVLGDAVRRSVDTLLLIGGFIILFATLTGMLRATGATARAEALAGPLLAAIGVDPRLFDGLLAGFFEISIGTQAAAQAPAPLLDRTIVCSAVIAWSGASVVAQVAAVTRGTGVNIWVYTLARAVHGVFSAVFTWLLWPAGLSDGAPSAGTVQTMAGGAAHAVGRVPPGDWLASVGFWHHIVMHSLDQFGWALLVLVAVAIGTVGTSLLRGGRR
ncbi:MAG: sporulation integral membrane protein YlbJ [Clostridia bacterium]|nr:sporulation integral membrane protein YlbJ [Clostridia bacterium]